MKLTALFFELKDKEREQLKELAQTARENVKQNDEWALAEKEMLKIHAKAHKRAFNYYSTHLDELPEALKGEIKMNVKVLAVMEEGGKKDGKLEAFLKENFLKDAAQYLAMLKEKHPPLYEEVISFLDYAFEHRGELSKKELEAGKGNKFELALIHPFSNKALSLMFDGKATQALGIARTTGVFDPMSRTLKITNGVNIFMPESVKKIGVGTSKLFRYIVAEFTRHNHPNAKGEELNLRCLLDVKQYAELNGVDIDSEDAMKNFRRKLKKELLILSSPVSWEEKIKGIEKRFSISSFVGGAIMTGNTLQIEFLQSMAEYLTSRPFLTYPHSLYSVEDREFNAFAIGEAMCKHYSIDNNVIRATEGKMKVETLLEYASFPSYEELKSNRWSWERYVKEPFERALDVLFQCGFLKSYSYCYEGGIEISDEEMRAGAIDSYEKFIALIVKYELNDFEDHATRAKTIAEKKAESIKKAKKSRKKKENTDDKPIEE